MGRLPLVWQSESDEAKWTKWLHTPKNLWFLTLCATHQATPIENPAQCATH